MQLSAGQSAAQHVSRHRGVTKHCQNHRTLCLPVTHPSLAHANPVLALYLLIKRPCGCPLPAQVILWLPCTCSCETCVCPCSAHVAPVCACSLCRPVSSPACQQAVEGSHCCMSSWASCAAPSPSRRPSGEPSTRYVRACMQAGTPESCTVHVSSFA